MLWMFTGYVGTIYVVLAAYVLWASPDSQHSLWPLLLIPLGLLAFGALETWWMIGESDRGEVRRAVQAGRLGWKTAAMSGAVTALCVAALMGIGIAFHDPIDVTDAKAARRSGI